MRREKGNGAGKLDKKLRDNVKEFLIKLLQKEVRPTQAAPPKKESVYLKVKITSEASSHHSG